MFKFTWLPSTNYSAFHKSKVVKRSPNQHAHIYHAREATLSLRTVEMPLPPQSNARWCFCQWHN